MSDREKELIEILASIEHDRWSDWYLHQRDASTKVNLKRWDRQAETYYKDLSEGEKGSDRREVMRYWSLIQPLVSRAELAEKMAEAIRNFTQNGAGVCDEEIVLADVLSEYDSLKGDVT